MLIRNLNLLVCFLALIILAGCVTTVDQEAVLKSQALEDRISRLEAEIAGRDSQIANLTSSLGKEKHDKENLLKTLSEQEVTLNDLTQRVEKQKIKTKPKKYYSFIILIQTALRNAGFESGLIDGKLGNRTRNALSQFQGENKLFAHGHIDKPTWVALREYLHTKAD
ncbi:MAG: peptidoglycan-binding domain-containing protein [Candidatus Omnitrophota bacterium]